jgi:nitrogen fixation/metabolism regulation signal transduction histidine kinase
MATFQIKQKTTKRIIFILLALSTLSLFALMFASDNPEEFNRMQTPILLVNTVSFFVLFVLVALSGKQLVNDYRKSKLGAKLRLKMTLVFGTLSIIPVAVVFFFATNFMNKGIDIWFDAEVETGLTNALMLGRSALNEQIQEGLFKSTNMSLKLSSIDELDQQLHKLREDSFALELLVLNRELQLIGQSTQTLSGLSPRLPTRAEIIQADSKQSWTSLDASAEGAYLIRVLVPVLGLSSNEIPLYLQSIFGVDPALSMMAASVEQTYAKYGRLTFLKIPLQYSYIFTLALVVLLALLIAVYGSIEFSKSLVKPIESLEEGTRSVAEGDLDIHIPRAGKDEIGILVNSFNEMVNKLASAQTEASESRKIIEHERTTLQAILSGLSAGVIVLDEKQNITLINPAASIILNVDTESHIGCNVKNIVKTNDLFSQFVSKFISKIELKKSWREKITLDLADSTKEIMCSYRELSSSTNNAILLLVFEDISDFLKAQKEAAWSDVARHMAHEIKNPLTPIQLSAERLRKRYTSMLKADDLDFLSKSTNTIINQVELMRDMANAFGEFAKDPELQFENLDLNQLLSEAVSLFEEEKNTEYFSLALDNKVKRIEGDVKRILQMLNNLLTNAIDAVVGVKKPTITISTKLLTKQDRAFVELSVMDNGHGFNKKALRSAFEPYFTQKTKGTGLGLAIVKKLVNEHNGWVRAQNNPDQGACLTITIPIKRKQTTNG